MSSNDMTGIWKHRGKLYVASISAETQRDNLYALQDAFVGAKVFGCGLDTGEMAAMQYAKAIDNSEYGIQIIDLEADIQRQIDEHLTEIEKLRARLKLVRETP